MIIELYGSPGAGKTYIKNSIISKKTSQENHRNKNALAIFVKRMAIYTPLSLKIKKEILKLIGETQGPKYNDVTLEFCVNNIVMVLFGYRHTFKRLLFMDEGVIHRLISLSINYDIKKENFIKIVNYLSPYLKESTIFYLYVSPENCYNAIKVRNRHNCNIDELDDKKLMNYLDDYKQYCDYACRKLGHQTINRGDIEKIKVMIYG